MRKLAFALSVAFIGAIAVVSFADPPKPVPMPSPSPDPGGGGGGGGGGDDCKECAKCMGTCATNFSTCARRCSGIQDADAQKTCLAGCPQPMECSKSCKCKGCGVPVH